MSQPEIKKVLIHAIANKDFRETLFTDPTKILGNYINLSPPEKEKLLHLNLETLRQFAKEYNITLTRTLK